MTNKAKTQHNMCWIPLYPRCWRKINSSCFL